jgi:mRNA interferase RelE/StbE
VTYRVEFAPLAQRQMRKLPREMQGRILERIAELATNPRPTGVKKLVDEENLYRTRMGDYRIVYQIRDRELLVVIVKVGHRREVYTR